VNKLEYRQLLQLVLSLNSRCWGCGGESRGGHHVIPTGCIKNPDMNMTIPMCRVCEKRVHASDNLVYLIKCVLKGDLYFLNKEETK